MLVKQSQARIKTHRNVSVFIVVQFLLTFSGRTFGIASILIYVLMQHRADEQIQISTEGWGHKISNHVTEGEERKWLIRISQELGRFMLCLG